MRRLLSRAGVLTIAAAVGITTAVVGVSPAPAEPGDLDPNPDARGWVNAPGGIGRQAAFGDVSVIPSVTGEFWTVGVRGDGTQRVLRILRHQLDGSDPAVGANQSIHDVGYIGDASAATSDGAGGAYVALSTPVGTDWAPMLVHVNADRTLDATFGRKVLPAAPSYIDYLDVARAPGGTVTIAVKHEDIFASDITMMRVLATGAMDSTYGNNGVGLTQRLDESNDPALAGMALAPDQSAYVVGSQGNALRIRKWSPTGGLDPSYGVGGAADPEPTGSFVAVSHAVSLDPLGRLLVGYRDFASGSSRARITRLLPNGTLDPAFGPGGSTTYDQPVGWDSSDVVGLAKNPGGGVATVWYVDPAGAAPAHLTRILFDDANGALLAGPIAHLPCTTRPHDVLVVVPVFAAAANSGASETWCTDSAVAENSFSNGASRLPLGHAELTVTPTGHVLAHPEIYEDASTSDIAVLTPAGQPDGSVGTDGFIETAFGAGTDFPYQDLWPGAGRTIYVRHGLEVARLDAAGALDSAFSGDGRVTPPGFVKGYAVLGLRDGGVMVSGQTATVPLRVVRYRADGTLDSGFDGDGIWESMIATGGARAIGEAADGSTLWDLRSSIDKTIRVLPGGGQDMAFGTGGQITLTASAATLDAEGRLLIATNGDGTVAVRRFTSSGQPDAGFGSGGVATLDSPAGHDQNAATLTVWPDTSMVVGLQRYPDGGGGVRLAWMILDSTGTTRASKHTGFGSSEAPGTALPDGRIVTLDRSDRLGRIFFFKGLPPAAPTLSAVATGPTTATLISTGDGAGLTSVRLGSEVGTTTSYGSFDEQPISAIRGNQQVTRTLTGLAPATTYHARAVLLNASGRSVSSDVTFTTPAAPVPGAVQPASKNPTVTITLPRTSKRTSIRAWRTIKGTAAPAAATPTVRVKTVQINLVRTITRKKCVVYTGYLWKKTTCKKAARKWIKVKGTTAWKRKINGLVRGSYTVRARCTDSQGHRSTAVAGVNRFRFKLKKR